MAAQVPCRLNGCRLSAEGLLPEYKPFCFWMIIPYFYTPFILFTAYGY
jgi:hypothetical protein